MQIQQIMSDRVIAVGAQEPVCAAARLCKRYDLGALPVCDDRGRLRGIVTDRDIVLRCVAAGADPRKVLVADVMSRGVVTAEAQEDIRCAARLMGEDQIRRLPVLRDGHLVGMVSLCDLAKHRCNTETAAALTELSQNWKRL